MYFAAQADLDEHLVVSRQLLKRSEVILEVVMHVFLLEQCIIICFLMSCRHPHIRVFSQLLDAHLYLLKRWVLDYLADNRQGFLAQSSTGVMPLPPTGAFPRSRETCCLTW